MARPITLFTGQWADLPLEELAKKVSEWGFDGLELACWGDHFEVDKALEDDGYVRASGTCSSSTASRLGDQQPPGRPVRLRPDRRAPQEHPARPHLGRRRSRRRAPARRRGGEEHGQGRQALWREHGQRLYRQQRVGQALLLPAHQPGRHRRRLPGFCRPLDPDPRRVPGRRASSLASKCTPPRSPTTSTPSSARWQAVNSHPAFGFNFDPSHLVHQFVDPAEFIDAFPDRIFHAHVKDSQVTLTGRNSILSSHLNFGDRRRGWDFVSPGHGDVKWDPIIRALNRIGYQGPLSIEWEDSRHGPRIWRAGSAAPWSAAWTLRRRRWPLTPRLPKK